MPRCPKCNSAISYLHEYEKAEARHEFRLDEKGWPVWTEKIYIDDNGELVGYECPECNQHLFDEEAEATDFLKGQQFFPVTRLCREEVAEMFPEELREEKMTGINDDDIEQIAAEVGDRLMDLYWDVLEAVVNEW